MGSKCKFVQFYISSGRFKCNVFICKGATAKLTCFLQRGIQYVPQIWLFCHRFIMFTPLSPFVFCLSLVNNPYNNVTSPLSNQHLLPDSRQILRHQYGISVPESQTFLLMKHLQRWGTRRKQMFSQASKVYTCKMAL